MPKAETVPGRGSVSGGGEARASERPPRGVPHPRHGLRHELWVNAAFDEGGGDRMYVWKGSSFKGLGKWTCGLFR